MSDEDKSDSEGEAAQSVNTVAVLLIAFAVLLFFYLIHIVLLPFVLAGAIAFVLSPLVDWLSRMTGAPRTAVALLVFFVLLALVVGAAYLVVPPMLKEGVQVLSHLQSIIEQPLQRILGDQKVQLLGQSVSAADIAGAAVTALRQFAERISSVFLISGSLFGSMFGFFLTLTLLAYFLTGGRRLAIGFIWLFPPSWRPLCARILFRLRPILLRYFAGIAGVVVFAGCAAYLGLGVFLKLKHAILLSVLTGFLEILPVVGPGLSAVLAGLVAVQQAKSIWAILAYVIYAIALRLSIDQVIGPLVLGNAGRVHPTLVIFCFLAGGVLFGIAGVILAVPAALTVKVVLATVYRKPVHARSAAPASRRGRRDNRVD